MFCFACVVGECVYDDRVSVFEGDGCCYVVVCEFPGANDFLGCCESVCWYEVDVFVVAVVFNDLFVLFLEVSGGEFNVTVVEDVNGWGVDVGRRRERKKWRTRTWRVVGDSSGSSSSFLLAALLLFSRLDEGEGNVFPNC